MTSIEQPTIITREEVRRHRGWVIGIGVALTVLGIAAIVFPFFASLAVEQLLGWILAVSGVIGVLNAFHDAKRHGFLLTLIGGLLAFAVGVVLLLYPLSGILSLTLLIAAFFLAGGVLRILLALQLRRVGRHGWTLTSGILGLVLGGLIVAQWPQAAAWLIGLLVGIDLIFAGVGSLALASPSREEPGASQS